MTDKARTNYALALLFAINAINFFDRQILGAVTEPIRKEWGLSDGAMGALGTAFTLLYALVGIPLGRLADRHSRTRVLVAGVLAWSVLTAASGAARSFWELFLLRLGVGVGEATCAPASTSLIGDLFPATKRAKALAIYMLGLPIGVALSYALSGTIAQSYGWRYAFYVAGAPGILCAGLALLMLEPNRGAAETHDIGSRKRDGSPYRLVLSIPTIWWVILSGALHNFNMYAIGSFLSPFLMRFHGVDIRRAGLISMIVFGLAGVPGLLIGGVLGDAVMKRRADGRLLLGAVSIITSVPFIFFALGRPSGDLTTFLVLMSVGCSVMYIYYCTVYPTIQDVIEPSLRGTAMALYFFAMYLLGASLGPLGTGLVSDYFTERAARSAGVIEVSAKTLEPFRAEGLHSAMYIIPLLGLVLTVILLAGSRTVTRDMGKLQRWMRQAATSTEA
jgi:predicted MFS family arabinose efflux permease